MGKHATFDKDLADSKAHSLKPVWEIAYKRFFGEPSLLMFNHTPSGKHSDLGIDRIVRLPDKRSFAVDEKFHRDNGRGYTDDYIHLEYKTVYPDGSEVPGWSNDPETECDLIAYAKEATETVYFFWKANLLALWADYRAELLAYRDIWTPNYDTDGNLLYTTHTLLIPAGDLYRMIRDNHMIQKIPDPEAWVVPGDSTEEHTKLVEEHYLAKEHGMSLSEVREFMALFKKGWKWEDEPNPPLKKGVVVDLFSKFTPLGKPGKEI